MTQMFHESWKNPVGFVDFLPMEAWLTLEAYNWRSMLACGGSTEGAIPPPNPLLLAQLPFWLTALSQQDPEKSNITVGFFIVLYRIWALFTGTNKDKILSRALFEIFIKIDGLYPFFQCRFYWVFWKSFLTAYLNSWWNFHSFDRSHYIILSKNAISHF